MFSYCRIKIPSKVYRNSTFKEKVVYIFILERISCTFFRCFIDFLLSFLCVSLLFIQEIVIRRDAKKII